MADSKDNLKQKATKNLNKLGKKAATKLDDKLDKIKGGKYYAAQIKAQSYIDDAKKVIGAKKTNVAIQSDTKESALKRIKRDIKHDTKAAASQIGNTMKAALKAPGRVGAAIANKVQGKDKGQSR